MRLSFRLNGKQIETDVKPDMLLLDLVRELGCCLFRHCCKPRFSRCAFLCSHKVCFPQVIFLSCCKRCLNVRRVKLDTLALCFVLFRRYFKFCFKQPYVTVFTTAARPLFPPILRCSYLLPVPAALPALPA